MNTAALILAAASGITGIALGLTPSLITRARRRRTSPHRRTH